MATGIVDESGKMTSRGTQCLAIDGHVCLSLGEKIIDDFLYEHHIGHDKEPSYPEGKYRADFLIGKTFVEYFGLAGDVEYDKNSRYKEGLCRKYGISLLSIYPNDLVTAGRLERIFAEYIK